MQKFDLTTIANRRKQLGISRKEMAEKLNFSNESVYWKYETGVYKFNAEMLPKLATIFQCPVGYFFPYDYSVLE